MADPLRLVVMVSGGGTTLANLVRCIGEGSLRAEVVRVVASRPGIRGIRIAEDAGIPVSIVPRRNFADQAAFSDRLTAIADDARADLVCLAGYLSLWTVPERYMGRVMNIHPALLPAFGGKGMYGHHVHEAVLAHGCKASGCTVHFVDNEYDNGPIILQRTVPAYAEDTPETLAERVFVEECKAYPEAIRLFGEGKLRIDGRVVRVDDPAYRP